MGPANTLADAGLGSDRETMVMPSTDGVWAAKQGGAEKAGVGGNSGTA